MQKIEKISNSSFFSMYKRYTFNCTVHECRSVLFVKTDQADQTDVFSGREMVETYFADMILEHDVRSATKNVKGPIYLQDPFIPISFIEDSSAHSVHANDRGGYSSD